MSLSRDNKTGTGSGASNMNEDQSESPAFTLSIVSPSVEVASPLTFPQLLATTTVEELKAKIRDVLESKPADSAQRLIHRGRMLERGSQTMSEIFGQDNVRAGIFTTQVMRQLTLCFSYQLWKPKRFI